MDDPIEPLDQVKPVKIPPVNIVENVYKILFSSFKIIIILLFFLFITVYLCYLVKWVYVVDEGTIVQPFEISGMKNVSGIIVADLFGAELNRILEINRIQQENTVSTETTIPLTKKAKGVNIEDLDLINEYRDLSSRNPPLNDHIAGIGSAGIGGSSLSIGQVLLSFKELAGKQPSTITGSLQRYGSIISVVVIWNNRNPPIRLARESRLTSARDNPSIDDQIPALISDLAFQIAIEMFKQQPVLKKAYPQTWQGFKHLTQATDAHLNYTMTGNPNDLEKARDAIMSIRHSEPGYIGSTELGLLSDLSSAYLDLGRPMEAEHLYKNISDIRPFESNLSLGLIYNTQGRKEDALKAFDNATKLNPISSEAWNNKGNAFYDLGKYKEALKAYDESIRLDPNSAKTWTNKGNTLGHQGKYEDAIEAYDEAIRLDPNNANAWSGKGWALNGLEKYEEAIKAFDKAIQIDPKLKAVWGNRGTALARLGKYDESIKCFDEVIRLDTKDAMAWNNKGASLYDLGRYDEAIKACDEAIKINQTFTMAWNNKGKALNALGRTAEANTAFAKAKELVYDDAIEAYDEAIRLDPNDANAWSGKGWALNGLGKYEEAIKAFDKAIQIDPKLKVAWGNRGTALARLGKYNESIKCFDEAIRLDAKDAMAWNNKGNALEAQDKYDEANAAFVKAKELGYEL